ncbi:MAG: hypothetical protein LUB60_05900, partial [Clostridiales bacterium]|nr:hypothetical protein [Clostridiales bacterium]
TDTFFVSTFPGLRKVKINIFNLPHFSAINSSKKLLFGAYYVMIQGTKRHDINRKRKDSL